MEALRTWLLTVISAAVLCSAAEALMPSGAVKQAGKLVCGLVLLLAVLSPAAAPDLAGGERWLEDYAAALEQKKTELRDRTDEKMKVIIEEKFAAYIVDKAREMGLDCSARVTCREENGILLPVRAEITGALARQERERLAALISRDLGVPLERQSYLEGGQP